MPVRSMLRSLAAKRWGVTFMATTVVVVVELCPCVFAACWNLSQGSLWAISGIGVIHASHRVRVLIFSRVWDPKQGECEGISCEKRGGISPRLRSDTGGGVVPVSPHYSARFVDRCFSPSFCPSHGHGVIGLIYRWRYRLYLPSKIVLVGVLSIPGCRPSVWSVHQPGCWYPGCGRIR
jgi:hypothetical protein